MTQDNKLMPCPFEWAEKVAKSKPPRYSEQCRAAANYILKTRPKPQVDVEAIKCDAVNFVFDGYFSARQAGKTHAKQRIEKLIDNLNEQGYLTTPPDNKEALDALKLIERYFDGQFEAGIVIQAIRKALGGE